MVIDDGDGDGGDSIAKRILIEAYTSKECNMELKNKMSIWNDLKKWPAV